MTDIIEQEIIERLRASRKFGKALVKEKRKQTKIANGRDAVDWRGQHGAVIEELTDDERPEPVKRVQPPVERMWSRGALDDAQYIAAKRLHNAYALGVCAARDPEAKGSGEASLSFGLAGATLVAIREYKSAQTAVGKRLWPYLDWTVCKDIPLSDLSAKLKRNPTELTALLKVALDMLGDHQSEIDNQTRKEVRRA
jgi:hypothetical protein